uniref:Uncharacterized protein n=1 Tax=Tanacetum cinerariifolium TaxID=118510 RepID=A0A6L2L0Z9_TANCI|nr:hypothetical protein [Tanacetum cinerariifolium]
MLSLLIVDQMSVPFLHRMSVVNVLASMETMLFLLHRYCTLPLEETCCSLPLEETSCSLHPEETNCFLPHGDTSYSLPPEETSCSLPPEETSCFLPFEETSYSLPPEETSCFLPLEETSYSLVIASRPEVSFVTLAIPVDRSNMEPRPEAVKAHPEVQLRVFWVLFGGSIGGAKTSIEGFVWVSSGGSIGGARTSIRGFVWVSSEGSIEGASTSIRGVVWVSSEGSIEGASTSIRGVVWVSSEGLVGCGLYRVRPMVVSSGVGFELDLDRSYIELVRCWFRFRSRSEVYFDFNLIFLMAKKDMHTYVSRLKDTKLDTLIATYDIPLDLRPRLPDSNFRMTNLPAGDTAIGISSRIFDSLM